MLGEVDKTVLEAQWFGDTWHKLSRFKRQTWGHFLFWSLGLLALTASNGLAMCALNSDYLDELQFSTLIAPTAHNVNCQNVFHLSKYNEFNNLHNKKWYCLCVGLAFYCICYEKDNW